MKQKSELNKAWSASVNDPNNKPYKDNYGTKHKTIDAIHYVVYNALRGKPLNRGFVENKYYEHVLYNFYLKIRYHRWDYLLRYVGRNTEYEEKLNEALRVYSNS